MAAPAAVVAGNSSACTYDVFISYNSAQKQWALALASRLKKDNFRVFIDEWEMPKFLGQTWMEVLQDCIEQTRKVVLVWSPEFFANEWPKLELAILQVEDPNNRKRKMIPLIHTQCKLPPALTILQNLAFAVMNDPSRTAENGTVDFEFRYEQLLYNLDNSRPYQGDFEEFKLLREKQSRIIDADREQLSFEDQDRRLRELRSVLYQAPRYTTPTYFLDPHLAVVHWNVAFELIFKRILPKIRRCHVNAFIAELGNRKEVVEHGRKFTEKVKAGRLPLVDLEPLVYESADYGRVELTKIATQLTDGDATLKAWSVSLLVRKIDWESFLRDLDERLQEDRLWGVYATSYDAVLTRFEPYQRLIEQVVNGVPPDAGRVLELGAGTGNVTKELLSRRYTVTAVENNPSMLEKMASKGLRVNSKLTVLFDSVENCSFEDQGEFDAAVAVNVAYALDDPLGCFRRVSNALRPGGMFALSTTHSGTKLDALLTAIEDDLIASGKMEQYREHHERLVKVNRTIERTIAKRYSIHEYADWLKAMGFEIVLSQPAYFDAVQVIHARKL